MQNKWFVLGLAGAAAICAWGAVAQLLGEMPLLALLPGALMVGLVIMAVRTARADSFGAAKKPMWNQERSPAVTSWLKDVENRAHPAAKATAPTLAAGKTK